MSAASPSPSHATMRGNEDIARAMRRAASAWTVGMDGPGAARFAKARAWASIGSAKLGALQPSVPRAIDAGSTPAKSARLRRCAAWSGCDGSR